MERIARGRIVQGSRRGGFLLHYGGFLYARNRVRQDKVYWRCDFEISLITAVETELPGAQIRCCYFHFTQSL